MNVIVADGSGKLTSEVVDLPTDARLIFGQLQIGQQLNLAKASEADGSVIKVAAVKVGEQPGFLR